MKIFSNEELKNQIQEYNSQTHSGYYSGLQELDNIVRLDKGQLTIITAQAAAGKTTFLNYYSYLMNRKNNLKTLFISMEMTAPSLICQLSNYQPTDEVLNNYFFADNSSISTIKDIRDAIATSTADIVVIDPFNLLPINEINTNTIGDTLRQFKQAAVTNNKIVILVAHPSKNIEYTQQHQYPTGLDIMGSANFNNIADTIIGMRRLKDNEVLFGVAKLRNNQIQGKQGATCTLSFDYNSKTFTGVTEPTQTVDLKAFKPLQTDYNVSYFNNYQNPNSSKEIALKDILNNDIDIDIKSQINLMRKTVTTPKQAQSIKCNLPTFTPCGTFKHRSADGLIHYTNLMSFDIDAKDNKDVTVDQIKRTILNSGLKNYIYYIGLSCSGHGLWGLLKIDGKESDYINHFNAMEKDFAKIGVNIDTSCKDISRQRFISTDDNYYINNNSFTYTKKYKVRDKTSIPTQPLAQDKQKDVEKLNDIVDDIEDNQINIIPTHQDSLQVIDTIINLMGEDGLKYWLRIRAQKLKYNEQEQTKAYNYQIERNQYHNSQLGSLIAKYQSAKGIVKAA